MVSKEYKIIAELAVVFQLDNTLPWQQYPGGRLPYRKDGGALRKF